MRRICIFAGSRRGIDPDFLHATTQLARAIVARGWGIVYGGASVGLMGALADAALAAGGEVIGVTPRSVFSSELPHSGLTKLYVVASMHRRKALMADLSDAFIALPGGFGTFDELFEVVTWAQLGIHSKPIGILDTCGYFDPLLDLIKHAARCGFINPEHMSLIEADAKVDQLLDSLASRASTMRKKVRPSVSSQLKQ